MKTDRRGRPACRRITAAATAVTLIVICAWEGVHAQEEDGDVLDSIVAVVENDAVMKSELDTRMETVMRRLRREHAGPLPPLDLLERQVLDRMVLERLQLQLAQRRGIRIDDVTLNEAMREIAQNNNLTLEEFRDRLVADGIDYAYFREQVRNELTIEQLRRRVVESKVRVSEQEIDDFIAVQTGSVDSNVEYRVRHILVSVPEGATTSEVRSAEARAEEVRGRALEGADFAQLATSYSDGQNALSGGDLGWRGRNDLPSIFERDVSIMNVGDVSELIRSPSGFHIIKLEGRRGQKTTEVTQTQARHILIRTTPQMDRSAARNRLETLRRRIQSGEDFGELAKANSDDTGSAPRGGDLGWNSPGELVPEFEAEMDTLRIGEISSPFETEFGWHIVQVIDRRDFDGTQDVMRAQARDALMRRKISEDTELWLRRLRDESYVEYRIGTPNRG